MTATGNGSQSDDCRSASDAAGQGSEEHALHIVLFQPEIPPNTGNIGRSCVALNAKLWIVRPFGFRLDSHAIRRSGLDYWQDLSLGIVDSWEHLLEELQPPNWWLLTKFGSVPYYEAAWQTGDAIVVGSESNGLPKSIRKQHAATCIHIPMPGKVRCLNQATSTGIVMYDAARQLGILDGVAPVAEVAGA